MHFPSIISTFLLAALTFSGTSHQTPVDGLEPRDLSVDATYLVSGFAAASFSLEALLNLLNTIGNTPVRTALAAGFNATETDLRFVLSRTDNILAITNEAEKNAVITAETTLVTNFQNLYADLASKVGSYDYLTKQFLFLVFTALKAVVIKLADNLIRTISNRPEVTQNRDRLSQVFAEADLAFKVRTIVRGS